MAETLATTGTQTEPHMSVEEAREFLRERRDIFTFQGPASEYAIQAVGEDRLRQILAASNWEDSDDHTVCIVGITLERRFRGDPL